MTLVALQFVQAPERMRADARGVLDQTLAFDDFERRQRGRGLMEALGQRGTVALECAGQEEGPLNIPGQRAGGRAQCRHHPIAHLEIRGRVVHVQGRPNSGADPITPPRVAQTAPAMQCRDFPGQAVRSSAHSDQSPVPAPVRDLTEPSDIRHIYTA